MDKNKKFGIIVLVVFLALLAGAGFFSANNRSKIVSNPTPTIVYEEKSSNKTITYHGENGSDALSLLKKGNKTEIGPSGLVVSINDRKADEKKHEYWAFYVNGKLSEVGPAEYQTNETDKIEWKMEKY